MGPSRPFRFVYCDDQGKFHLDPEGVAALQLIKGPAAIVSVCGRARQGKSFLLNQVFESPFLYAVVEFELLGRSSGFQVASTHQPCTKGLWIWSAPVKQIALDGTEYHLLFLDSEGIDACDQTMGGIDEAALDHLSLVTEITKHIHIRAGGERATASEIARFSPIFVWLLRDFYLDLSEDNRKITPCDYLEIALSPTQGGKDLSAKNEAVSVLVNAFGFTHSRRCFDFHLFDTSFKEMLLVFMFDTSFKEMLLIRESIRALFPDRECFVLVRPLNNESDLQRLDQFSLADLRPEFRAGLNALKKCVLERTRPKQVGAMIMTGPLLAGVTKSFLDAINNGTVPEISTSLLNVEERECRRAYESATELYVFSFDRTKPLDEAILREVHNIAVQKSLAVFSSGAVGSGPARQKYEKLLQIFFRKAFEDYKRDAFLKANSRISDAIRSMETKLQEVCNPTNTKLEDAVKVLDGLIVEYEKSSDGPGKWQKLTTFLQQSFRGPIYKLVKKQWDQIESENTTLTLKCHLNEEKLRSLEKQLEEAEKCKANYLRNYEKAINDKNKVAGDYSRQMYDLEVKYVNAAKALDAVKLESSEWKRKYQQTSLKQRAEEELASAEIATLRSRRSAAEASLALAQEQAMIFQAEALDWKQKYDKAVIEAKTALEKATRIHEHSNEHAQKREEALRAEFLAVMTEKVKEEAIKKKQTEIKALEDCMASSRSELKDIELKLENYGWETSMLRHEIKELHKKLCHAEATAQLHQEEAQKMLQEKRKLEQLYQFDSQRLKNRESHRSFKLEAGTEPEQSLVGVNVSHIEKSNVHSRSTMEGMRQTEGGERHAAILERGEAGLVGAVEMLHNATSDETACSPDYLLEGNQNVEGSPSQLQCPQERLNNLEEKLITSTHLDVTNMETKLLTNGVKDSPSFQKCNSHTFRSSLSTLPTNWFHGRVGSSSRHVRAHIQSNGHGALSRAIGIPCKPSPPFGN
ncbi:hypothetical protein ACLOJK_009785 [Asimina triloba]